MKQWDSTAFIIWHFWILPLWYSCLRFQEPGNRNDSLTTNHSFPPHPTPPVLLPLMHEGNATVGRMSLSVGLDVGQGGGARVDYSVALPGVYALLLQAKGGLFRPFTQKWHLMLACHTAPKSSTPQLGNTAALGQKVADRGHDSLRYLRLLEDIKPKDTLRYQALTS